jgi:hypothetical protein
MKRTPTITATALLTALSVGCVDVTGPVWDNPDWPNVDWPSARDTTGQIRTTFEWSGLIAEGDRIEITGIFGDIRAVQASGNEVAVKATKIGQPDDVADVDIEVVPHAGGITICAVYPDVPGRRANLCQPGDGGNMTVRDSAGTGVEVEFRVEVPQGVVFAGRTVRGHVEATGLASDAFVSTVFGDALVSTTRLATAKTVSGSIIASIGLPDWDRDLEFTTVTGDIVVTVPNGTNADVHARVLNGRITSDFPLTQLSSGDMRGTLGAGGRNLELTTMGGDIELRRGS